jgi:hypothetical protein
VRGLLPDEGKARYCEGARRLCDILGRRRGMAWNCEGGAVAARVTECFVLGALSARRRGGLLGHRSFDRCIAAVSGRRRFRCPVGQDYRSGTRTPAASSPLLADCWVEVRVAWGTSRCGDLRPRFSSRIVSISASPERSARGTAEASPAPALAFWDSDGASPAERLRQRLTA